jgi:hypothetical protein
MLYHINNYFNVQDSGSGIGILTGSSLSSYDLTVNGYINANNINFDSVSGISGVFYKITGLKNPMSGTQISGQNLFIYGYQEGSLPLAFISGNTFSGNIFTGNNLTGQNFDGNDLSFQKNLYGQNIYSNEKIEFLKIYSKNLELSGNLNILNPTGKIEINKEKQINIDIISNAPVNSGVSISGYKNSFAFQDPDEGAIRTYIYGNDSAGTIFFEIISSQASLNYDSPICRVFFTGNYSPEDYNPSVVINLINQNGIFKYQNGPNSHYLYVTDVDVSGFTISTNSYSNTEFFKFSLNYLVIS